MNCIKGIVRRYSVRPVQTSKHDFVKGTVLHPEVEAWAHYRENSHKSFHLTGKNTIISMGVFLGLVPLAVYYGGIYQEKEMDVYSASRNIGNRGTKTYAGDPFGTA